MSTRRHARAIRALGGFSGGTSRLARPWAELEEADVRPREIVAGPIGVYRIYALGESLGSGSNVPLVWDGGSETSSGDIDIALEEDPFNPGIYVITVHGAGVYSGAAHVVYGGTVGVDPHATVYAFDNGVASGSTDQVPATGNPFDFTSADLTGTGPFGFDGDGRITFTVPDGYWFLGAGPGLQSGTTIEPETYLEVSRWS